MLPEKFRLGNLEKRYGRGRNLNHNETRALYLSLIDEIRLHITKSSTQLSLPDRAILCSALRRQIRLYARSRDGTFYFYWLTDLMLQVRDAYVHALMYLPKSLYLDAQELVKGNFFFQRSLLVIKQICICLFPHYDVWGCPSVTFLKEIKNKTDSDILDSCIVTNSNFNRIGIRVSPVN
ncbi:hypothetical protein TRVL_04138 [Trypanosoma vivax]|nr:hypothetical protein TRVL_04138 [Trypanosoma vivax]